jgi:hypothetical protein
MQVNAYPLPAPTVASQSMAAQSRPGHALDVGLGDLESIATVLAHLGLIPSVDREFVAGNETPRLVAH